MLADHVEENLAVLLELGLADAVHGAHPEHGRWLEPHHVEEGLVGEHDIGRHPLLLGELRPAAPQRFEQRRVVRQAFGERGGVGGGARAFFPRGRLERVLAQRDFFRALEHAPAGIGDRPGAIAGVVERDDAGGIELAEDRAPFLPLVFLADAEGR